MGYFYCGKIQLSYVFDSKSHREMFLMKKNHLDFKALAQSLAMDKSKLELYVTVSLLLMLLNSSVCIK